MASTSSIWDAARRTLIRDALAAHQWRAAAAARYLGMGTSSIRHYIEVLGLQSEYDERKPGRGRPATESK